MKRYFFDRVSCERAEYDFRGREFSNPEAAHQLAEIIALDLGLMDEGGWCGWSIKVRNAIGQQLFLVPVPEAAPMAG